MPFMGKTGAADPAEERRIHTLLAEDSLTEKTMPRKAMIVSPDHYLLTESGEYIWSVPRVKEAWASANAKLKGLLASGKYDQLVLMVGVPASGKSTWLKSHQVSSAIYFDATFTSARIRKLYIDMAKEAGMSVVAVFMQTPLAVCLDRNSCRTVDRRVPEDTMTNMSITLAGDPPTMAEGFDDIIMVNSPQARTAIEGNGYDFAVYRVAKTARSKTAQSNAKVVEIPNTFRPVVLEEPKATREEFPFEGFIDFQGLRIDVENAKGSSRSGEGPEGPWSIHMFAHYGGIRGTEGTDGDKLDVYVGDNHDSSLVVVIHQHNPWDGAYDEDKVVLGCESVEEAIGLYKKQYDRPGFFKEKEFTVMPIGAFWRWVNDERNQGKRVKMARKAGFQMSDTPVFQVEGRKGWAMLQSGGSIKTLTDALNMHMVRRVPPPGEVPKVTGAVKAFSFHWSNAQAKWDAIAIRDFPWSIDGAEFILFLGKNAVSPVGKSWSLSEMRYIAQGLNHHPGFASAVRAAATADKWISVPNLDLNTVKGAVWVKWVRITSSGQIGQVVARRMPNGWNIQLLKKGQNYDPKSIKGRPKTDADLMKLFVGAEFHAPYVVKGQVSDAVSPVAPAAPARAPAAPTRAPVAPAAPTLSADEVTNFLRSMGTRKGGRNRNVVFYNARDGWSAEPDHRQRLDHYVGSYYNPGEDDDPEGWDSEGWEDEYAGPLRKEVQDKLDARFGKGVLSVDIGEKGHIDVSLTSDGQKLLSKTGGMWKKGYVENQPGALNAAKTVFSNLLALLRALQWNHLASHWQCQGDASYGDHLLFERIYGTTVKEVDALAEKLVGTYGVAAVDARQQAKLMAFTLHQMGKMSDPFERGVHFERVLQVELKKCIEAMEDIGQLSLGMDDFLRTVANDHETNIYLLQQKLRGTRVASAMGRRYSPLEAVVTRFHLRRLASQLFTYNPRSSGQ